MPEKGKKNPPEEMAVSSRGNFNAGNTFEDSLLNSTKKRPLGKVGSLLMVGEANAIKSDVLATVLGFKSASSVRMEVQRERQELGSPIVATANGYFIAANDEDIERWYKVQESRLIANRINTKWAREYLKNRGIEGQERMDVYEDL